jgi:hypothetical protein
VSVKPAAEIVGIVGDAEAFVDELDDAGGRPEVGAKAERRGVLREPVAHLRSLTGGEFGIAARMGTQLEAVFALRAIPTHPIADAPVGHLERLGDGELGFAFEDALDSKPAAVFLGLGIRDATNEFRRR